MINIKLFLLTALSLMINLCSGQEHKNELGVKHTIANTSLYSAQNKQISQVVRTIFQDSRGTFWLGTQNGAFKLVGDSLIHLNEIKSEWGKGVTIKGITESKDGKVWFGHTDGISSVDGNKVTNYYVTDGLISNDVWCITADSKGKIWIGTIEGICVFNGTEFTDFELPEGIVDSTRGISSTKIVHSIMEDSKGTLWFSSNAGLLSYSNNSLINVSKETGIQTNFANEIVEDKAGRLWVSTKKGLYELTENGAHNITEGKIENGKGIGSIAEDKDGNIWFVSNQHFLYVYNKKQKKLIEFEKTEENKGPIVFQIYKDQNDRLWFVGFGGAYRLENGKFINITMNGPW